MWWPCCGALCGSFVRERRRVTHSRFRFIKYGVGADVSPHPDSSGGDKHTPVREPNCSLFTCLLYLNDGYEGCETCLLPSPKSAAPPEDASDDGWPQVCRKRGVVVPPKVGRVLVFEHDILHACPPLETGEKLVVRVDLCYERRDLDGKALRDPFRDSTLDAPKGSRVASASAKSAFSKLAKSFGGGDPGSGPSHGKPKMGLAARIKAQIAEDEKKKAARRSFPRASVGGAPSKQVFQFRTAMVTGASSGIGACVCYALAVELGMTVFAIARRGDRLDELRAKCRERGGDVRPIVADVLDKDAMVAAFKAVFDRAASSTSRATVSRVPEALLIFRGAPRSSRGVV